MIDEDGDGGEDACEWKLKERLEFVCDDKSIINHSTNLKQNTENSRISVEATETATTATKFTAKVTS